MTATDHLGPQFGTMYHATRWHDVQEGDTLTPGARPTNFEMSTGKHVYMATDANEAAWASASGPWRADEHYHASPRVFEVHPTGSLELDPDQATGNAYRTTDPVRVGREVTEKRPVNEYVTGKGWQPGAPIACRQCGA